MGGKGDKTTPHPSFNECVYIFQLVRRLVATPASATAAAAGTPAAAAATATVARGRGTAGTAAAAIKCARAAATIIATRAAFLRSGRRIVAA